MTTDEHVPWDAPRSEAEEKTAEKPSDAEGEEAEKLERADVEGGGMMAYGR